MRYITIMALLSAVILCGCTKFDTVDGEAVVLKNVIFEQNITANERLFLASAIKRACGYYEHRTQKTCATVVGDAKIYLAYRRDNSQGKCGKDAYQSCTLVYDPPTIQRGKIVKYIVEIHRRNDAWDRCVTTHEFLHVLLFQQGLFGTPGSDFDSNYVHHSWMASQDLLPGCYKLY